VQIFSDGVLVGQGTAVASRYSITVSPLADGIHTITAKETDLAGNVSATSAGLAVTIDTQAPTALAAPDLTAASDSGTSNSDDVTNTLAATFTGAAPAGTTVRLFSDGVLGGGAGCRRPVAYSFNAGRTDRRQANSHGRRRRLRRVNVSGVSAGSEA